MEQKSRLSKNLTEILSDKTCLSYFIQFLETKKSLALVKFWLDVESFRIAAQCCFNGSPSCSSGYRNKNNYKRELSEISDSDDVFNKLSDKKKLNKSVSSDGMSFQSFDSFSENCYSDEEECTILPKLCEEVEDRSDMNFLTDYKEACDISRKSLTDDEKSKICEIKKITECDRNIEETESNTESNKKSKFHSTIATDAIRIFKKYLTTNSIHFVDVSAIILSDISLALCTNQDSNNISANCFDEAQRQIFVRLENEFLNEFVESVFYSKFTVDILSNDEITLNDILFSESALFYFMEFLEQENKRIFLEFWMSANNFKNNLENDYEHNHAQNDAMILYEKYFSLQATNSLEMSKNVRLTVESNICEIGNISNCFNLPIRIIENYLDKKYFKLFLKSQLYYQYLSELFNKIEKYKIKDEVKKKSNHRKTNSDCTYENTKDLRSNYISSQNTLLAMESSTTKIRSSSTSDMQIDSRQIYNPDLLWRRRNSVAGLSFGRISALGRYEREFDEIDSIKTEQNWSLASGSNRLKKAVKKLVNLPEDKVREEIAWQVAEMIVKDITNVTLSNGT